ERGLCPGLAVSRLRADGGDAAVGRVAGQPQADAAADAANGDRGAGAEAADDEHDAWTQDLPVSPEEPSDGPAEPGMGGGHHLCADRAWVPLPGGGDRLGER